jgi:hypothetical protein
MPLLWVRITSFTLIYIQAVTAVDIFGYINNFCTHPANPNDHSDLTGICRNILENTCCTFIPGAAYVPGVNNDGLTHSVEWWNLAECDFATWHEGGRSPSGQIDYCGGQIKATYVEPAPENPHCMGPTSFGQAANDGASWYVLFYNLSSSFL